MIQHSSSNSSNNQQEELHETQPTCSTPPPHGGNDNNSNGKNNTIKDNMNCSSEKYGLRPRNSIKRLQQERPRQQVAKGYKGLTRPKSRPAPLSKYRRKTANARERHRMLEINNAFESLRRVLPDAVEVEAASASMTKITTLRLAADYIRALSGVLQEAGGAALCSLPASPHHHTHHHHHLLDLFSASHTASSSRGSLSSSTCSDLDDLLSDDSCSLIGDSLDVFHDIPSLPGGDPLDLLLEADKGLFPLPPELCN